MNQEVFWNLFLDTGAPEAFLLYRGIQRKKGEYYEEKYIHINDFNIYISIILM